jgi:hypothetical protein
VARVVESAPADSQSPPIVEVVTSAGSTAATPAVSPDTAEADLTQPSTEGVLDSSTAKRIATESDQLRRAAERNPQ